jgi:hypothetical protein
MQMLQKLGELWTENANFFAKNFGENIFKTITSVTEDSTFLSVLDTGTDVMIFEIFLQKKLAFLTQNKAKLCKNFDQNIGF